MTIKLDKDKQDIILLCASALILYMFSYSYFGLLMSFLCICGILFTGIKSWYKNKIDKIDNYCGKHELFTFVYSYILSVFILVVGEIDASFYLLFNLGALGRPLNFIFSIINFMIMVVIISCGLLKRQSYLPRLLTYLFFGVILVHSIIDIDLYIIQLILSSLVGTFMFVRLKNNKKE